MTGNWGNHNESLPNTAVRNTVERSFSINLIKTFHRSTMTDERLTKLAVITNESETAETKIRYD